MKRLFLTIIAAVVCANTFAQTALPATCSVWLPKKLDTEVIKKTEALTVTRSPYGQSPAPSRKNFWVVYSDREHNVTYQSPRSGSAKFSELSFNERLIIAKIENGYALVYSEPKTERYPYISSAATSRGWVPMSNLLLWTKGLADEAYISYKAIICANLNVGSSDAEGKLYKAPNGSPVGKLATNMQFYFIMKEEGNKVLLAKYATLPTGSSTGLYGWVDKNSFVPWNHRTCLEPTWDRSNVEWLATNNKKWQVFASKDKLTGTAPAEERFTKTTSNITGTYASEFLYRTMSRQRLRYPILEGSTKDLYHVSSFGTIGKAPQSQTNLDDDIAVAIANLNNTKKIKIGILIDGTASMKNYFTSVQNAIIEGCKYFDQSLNVEVAVAIYRDKEDGAYVFESFPSMGFTKPNNANLRTFLSTAGKYGAKSAPTDKDGKEALYYGIKKSIETFNFNPSESNLLLVVGDCGDNGKMGVTREVVIKDLADKNVNLMAFQVRNKENESFQSFVAQLPYIMRKSLEQRYATKAQFAKVENTAVVIGAELSDKTGWDVYNKNKKASDTELHRYVCRRKHVNGEMSVDELSKLLEGTIRDWNKQIEGLIEIASKVVDGDFEAAGNEGDGTLTAELIAICGSKERYERIKRVNALVSFRGWTYKKDPVSKRDLWKTVVFFPAPELKTLITKLEPVYNIARTRSDDRRPYIEAMTKLAETLTAQNLSGMNVKDLPYKKIIAVVFGLDDSTTDLGGPSLEDIGDPNVVSKQHYLGYCNKMARSYEYLLKMISNPYPFIYDVVSSQDQYYWLPSEHLPL